MNPQDLAGKNPTPGIINTPNLQNSITPTQSAQTLSASEVAKHSTEQDCWMIISGKVYDLSNYVNHPGGTAYVPYCGTDATEGFNTKDGRGRPHSSAAVSLLTEFEVGVLGQPAVR